MNVKSLKRFTLLFLKFVSASFVAYVMAFIGKELINYGSFSFVFIFISIFSAFLYVMKNQNFIGVLITNIILVAIALFLRFYVILAYGS